MELLNGQQAVDLRDYFRILSKRKWLLIFPIVITILTVMAGSYFITPVYESATTILVAETSLLSPTFSRLVPDENQRLTREQRQERLNTIRNQIISTSYLAELIRRLEIPISDDTKAAVNKLHRQFPEVSELELAQKLQVEKIRKNINVFFQGSNLVQITAGAHDPLGAAEMARTLAQIYIDESLAGELVGVKGAMDFSDEMLAVYRERLNASESELRRFEQRQLTRNIEQDSSLAQNLLEVNSAIDATDLELNALSNDVEDLRSELLKAGIRDPQITYSRDLTNRKFALLEGISDLTDLLTKYSWRDAKVVKLNEQARLRLDEIETAVQQLASAQYPDYNAAVRQKVSDVEFLSIRLSFLREKKNVLRGAIEKVKGMVSLSPALQQKHSELTRKVEENRRIFELFSDQLTGSQINQAATRAEAETKFKIIEPAAIPIKPVKPDRVKLSGIGAVLGFALGLGAILLVEFLDNSFRKVEEVEAFLGLRVVGTIPRIELPFTQKSPGRAWVYTGTVISLLLLAFVIILSQQH
ncbi:MAG: hypothetical protein GY855_00150 [candidate division Zixibacteria bacterium]|nr:hypothetical protein [candidate division Zixibacteria bacterium]